MTGRGRSRGTTGPQQPDKQPRTGAGRGAAQPAVGMAAPTPSAETVSAPRGLGESRGRGRQPEQQRPQESSQQLAQQPSGSGSREFFFFE